MTRRCARPPRSSRAGADRGSSSGGGRRGAAETAGGGRRPGVESGGGPRAVRDRLPLHRRSLDALLAAAAVLLLAIAVMFVMRANGYARQARSFDGQLVDAFRAQFPG